MESRIRRKLAQELSRIEEELKEALEYGVPHVVGEIFMGNDPEITLSVAVFSDSKHSWVLRDNGSILFMHPAEDASPHRLFFEIWRLLDGKKRENNDFGPGSRIRGILKASLQRKGFEILWMNVRAMESVEYIEVWAIKGEERYNMLFQKLTSGDYVLVEMKKV
jgi:hypothetical protein